MTVGAWDPTASGPPQLATLQALAACCASGIDTDEDVRRCVDANDVARLAGLMRRPADEWAPVVALLGDDELLQLVRFFTLAEGALPGWEAGARSPVVPMARALRARKAWPSTQTAWIRTHSTNRFLPYGSINL